MIEGIKNALTRFYINGEKRIKFVAFVMAIVLCACALMGCAIKPYTISDGSKTYKVYSLFSNLNFALSKAKLKSDNYKVLKVNGSNVNIAYVFPVYIVMGENTVTVNVTGGTTVADILKTAGFIPDEHDMIEPSLDTVINSTAYIDYTNIDYVTGSYKEVVSAMTEIVYSSEYKSGTEKLKSGSNGLREVYYTSMIVNGKTVKTTVNKTVTLNDAVDSKRIIGTKTATSKTASGSKNDSFVKTSESVKHISTLTPKTPIKLDKNNNPVNYTKKITVQATAYTYTGHNCATGKKPQPGYIAVNPKVIPYGTKLYIKTPDGKITYGYAVAADTGGFVKHHPNNVDLFFSTESECESFGRRNVEIYFIK